MSRRFLAVPAIAVLMAATPDALLAQQVLVDRGVRAEGLWCFPVAADPGAWLYVPDTAGLATGAGGEPEFSLVRYVLEGPAGEAGADSITRAGGGGVLHFLVLYETAPERVRAAEAELRRRFDDDELQVRGPVLFDEGRYTLISSIVRAGDDSHAGVRALASGDAPLLEGNRIALSFDLEPEKAGLLMQSLSMGTSDISIAFDMGFEGLADSYDAEVVVDWSRIHERIGGSVGGSIYFVGVDVEAMVDEMFQDGTIELRSRGTDATMEALLDRAYARVIELLFDPVSTEELPTEQQGGLNDALRTLTGQGGLMSGGQTTGFGIHVGFEYRKTRTEGTTVLRFDHAGTVRRRALMTFNLGDLYRVHGDDPRFFRAVNLGDPTFQQREIRVAVDGSLLPEFDRLVNSVTVTLRKRHGSGEDTVRELVLDGTSATALDHRLVYGWQQDHDRLDWLEYEYRTQWSFEGGGRMASDWARTSAAMIDLFAPYRRRTVQLVGDAQGLAAHDVRAVVVQVSYPFFGEIRREQQVVRVDSGQVPEPFEITLPLGQLEYEYAVTWILEGDRRLTSSGRDSTGIVFIDELPAG